MRKPAAFAAHPVGFAEARDAGLCRAVGAHVVDGDTFDALLDLGFYCYAYETIRLAGIDTPEIYRPDDDAELERGRAAKEVVATLIEQRPLLVRTHEEATFGRFVADVLVRDGEGWRNLADVLREAGFAEAP